MSKLWSDFYDHILPSLPGCGQDVANVEIKNIVLDFFNDTGIYTVTATPVDIVAGTGTYSTPGPAGWDVAWIRKARVSGVPITPSGEDELEKKYTDWETEKGDPVWFMQPDQNSIRLVPQPINSVTGGLEMRQVLKPQRSATGFSTDWVFDNWVDIIAYGIMAKLMAMPAKQWSNPALSASYEAKYRAGVGDATRNATRSLTRAQKAVRMNPAA
jgi:hypothetical protein